LQTRLIKKIEMHPFHWMSKNMSLRWSLNADFGSQGF